MACEDIEVVFHLVDNCGGLAVGISMAFVDMCAVFSLVGRGKAHCKAFSLVVNCGGNAVGPARHVMDIDTALESHQKDGFLGALPSLPLTSL